MLNTPITSVDTQEKVVALTFDDGPDPLYTPKLLDVLRKHNAKASFFLVGQSIKKHPEIVREIVKDGHEIGNHTWNHRKLTSIKSSFRRLRQIWACKQAISIYSSKIFRPPYGAFNRKIQIEAALLGYRLILWNVSAQDWIRQDANVISQKIVSRCKPGNIFLLHDTLYSSHLPELETQWDRIPMIQGLDDALSILKGEFNFITLSELIKCGHPLSNWPIKEM